MIRLTEKSKYDFDDEYGYASDTSDRKIRNKLGKLEDIEEELGIDLITLFKALKNGIWEDDKYCNEILYLKPENFTIVLKEKYIYYEWGWPGPDYFIYHFKDYGKTWALTREELENDN